MQNIFKIICKSSSGLVRNVLFTVAAMMIIAAICRCEKISVEEYEPQLNIFAVLRNDLIFQEIIVDRTYALVESVRPYVEDALVVLEGNAIIDTCRFDPFGYYSSFRIYRIHSDTTYRITVTKEGFDTLIGETTVPGDFSIVAPADQDTVTLDDTIVITTGRGAALYSVCTEVIPGMGSWLWFRCSQPDSFVVIPINYLITDTLWSAFKITVTAFDPNFYKYHYETTDSVIRAGVTGGVGLFGSTYVKRINVYLRLPTEGKRPVAIVK